MAGKLLFGRLQIGLIDIEERGSTNKSVSASFECSISDLAVNSVKCIASLATVERKGALDEANYWKQVIEVCQYCVGLAASSDECAT